MIKVTVGKNTGATVDVMVPKTATVRSVLEEQNLTYTNAFICVGGMGVRSRDSTFEDLGVNDSCFLTCTIKADAGR